MQKKQTTIVIVTAVIVVVAAVGIWMLTARNASRPPVNGGKKPGTPAAAPAVRTPARTAQPTVSGGRRPFTPAAPSARMPAAPLTGAPARPSTGVPYAGVGLAIITEQANGLIGIPEVLRSALAQAVFIAEEAGRMDALKQNGITRDGNPNGRGASLLPELKTALVAVMQTPDLVHRLRCLKILGLTINSAEFAAVTPRLDPESRDLGALKGILPGWIAVDPAAAAKWVEALPESKAREEALMLAAVVWTDKDPDAARAWLEAQPKSRSRELGWRQYIGQVSQVDPATGAAALPNIGDQSLRDSLISLIASAWTKTNHAEAAAWIQAMPAGLARDEATLVYVGQVASIDIRVAVESLPAIQDEQTRNRALPAIAGAWARQDVTAAGAWLQSLPPGAPKDDAVVSFCEVVAGTDTNTATVWAQRIGDEGKRKLAFIAIDDAVGEARRIEDEAKQDRERGLIQP